MLGEVADLTKAMRELLMTADRFIYFGGLIVAAALSFGMARSGGSDPNWIVLVFAPYGLAIVFGYLIQVYTEVEKRAGYKKYLEERINSRCPEPVLLESYVNSHSNRNRLSVIGLQVLNGFGFLLLLFLSGLASWRHAAGGGRWIVGDDVWSWHLLNLLGLAFAAAVLLRAGWENMRAGQRAEREAARQHTRQMRARRIIGRVG
jgi:hypothetical protein